MVDDGPQTLMKATSPSSAAEMGVSVTLTVLPAGAYGRQRYSVALSAWCLLST